MPKSELVKLTSPSQLQEFSNVLKSFIVKQNLFSNIKGKNYVNVEGWEFAGAATGISPIVKSVVREDSAGEIKYRAEVELVNNKGEVIGWGMAICSNKEASKKSFDEYAIASMAQTRAIGKAFRNKLAFLMKMAGYESTPAEEAVEKVVTQEVREEDLTKPATDNQKQLIENFGGVIKENMTKGEAIEIIKRITPKE
jgi:hypothetical protein